MGIMTNGVKQWIFQRIANATFVIFGICLIYIFITDNGLSYRSLTELLSSTGFKIYILITLVLAVLNSMLAAWQIDGDYARKFGIPTLLITIISIIGSVFYLIYGLKIII